MNPSDDAALKRVDSTILWYREFLQHPDSDESKGASLRQLGIAYYERGNLNKNHGNLDNAETDYGESIKVHNAELPLRHSDEEKSLTLTYIGFTYLNRGKLTKEISDYDEAIKAHNAALQLRVGEQKGRTLLYLGDVYDQRGNLNKNNGNLDNAKTDYGEAIKAYNKAVPLHSFGETKGITLKSLDKTAMSLGEVLVGEIQGVDKTLLRDAWKDVGIFSTTSNKSEFSLEGCKIGNAVQHVLGLIARVGGDDLKTLNLSNCGLEEPLDISAFKDTKLEELILRNNTAQEITGFEEVHELKKIDFSKDSGAAGKAAQASEYIVDVAPYAGVQKLEEVSFANSGITAVTGLGAFKERPKLKKMDLSGNPLSDIPDDLFSLPGCEIPITTTEFSPIVKKEYLVAVCLNQGHTVHGDDATSSMRKTQLTLNAAEEYNDAVKHDVTEIARQSPETAQRLQGHLAPQIQIQATGDQMAAIYALFGQWEDPERPESTNPQLTATARHRRYVETAAEALLHGSRALQSVPGRSDVQSKPGWNAVSKIAHGALQAGAIGTAFVPFVSGAFKGADALLGAYSDYNFQKISQAVSQVLEPDEVESFCKSVAFGDALMTMRTLGIKALGIQEELKKQGTSGKKKQDKLTKYEAGIKAEAAREKDLATGYTAKAILALAFGEAINVREEDAADQLRGMTTKQKAEATVRYLCKAKKIEFKSHLFPFQPSLSEQSIIAVKGLTRAVLATANSGLEIADRFNSELAARTKYLENELFKRDAVIQKLGKALEKQGKAIDVETKKRWDLKDTVRPLLRKKLSWSAGEEEYINSKSAKEENPKDAATLKRAASDSSSEKSRSPSPEFTPAQQAATLTRARDDKGKRNEHHVQGRSGK